MIQEARNIGHDVVAHVLPVVVAIVIIGLLVYWFIAKARPDVNAFMEARHEERIALCMRAYEFTHDRCEFIISNGGRDLVKGGKE